MTPSAETAPLRPYPLRLDASLDPDLSRWMWLVKWLLAIPHFIILIFLWIAFFLASVAAFFAILVTGRYPQGLFDFNVGVMRWTWRVSAYAHGVLSTDRYPPFTLADVHDYPAHLEVARPGELSRGLVLVKWWLLAIPHYLVVAALETSGGVSSTHDRPGAELSAGLITVLVVIAAVTLLFTGRYPRPLFDLVVGLQRWVLRVVAYAALMTDQYPPFRLDQGGTEASAARTPGDVR
ncbi:MAG: transrane protein [Aeromicrobium sp.]|jgi:hypothetical protein|nr:transrane protein [Aeromicrobium sp.]